MTDWRIKLKYNNFMPEKTYVQFEREKWEDIANQIAKEILLHIDCLDNLILKDEILQNMNKEDGEKLTIILDHIKQKKWGGLGEEKEIARLLGEKLASQSGEYIDKWELIGLSLRGCWTIYEAWIEFLHVEDIRKVQNQIMEMPKYVNPLELIDTWGVYREKEYWASVFQHIEDCNKYIIDPWKYIEKIIPGHEEIRLKYSMELRNNLIKKLGWSIWLQWVSKLPIIHLKKAAMGDIDDIELISSLIIELIKIEEIEVRQKSILAAFWVECFLTLCDQIQQSLDYAVKKLDSVEYKVDFLEEKRKWEENDLHLQVKALLDNICYDHNEAGLRLVESMFKHMKVMDGKKYVTLVRVRGILVEKIAQLCKEVSGFSRNLFSKLDSQTKLLNATLLFFQIDANDKELLTQIGKIIRDSYIVFLISEKYFWSGNFSYDSDEGKLLWNIAGVIASREETYSYIVDLIEKIYKFEGWKYEYSEFLDSTSKVANCLTVGVMATEWMMRNGNIVEAVRLYEFVWNKTHKWIRWVFDDRNERVIALLISLWARLLAVCPDNYINRAFEALGDIDSLKHQIICLKVLRKNLGVREQKIELPSLLQEKIYLCFSECFVNIKHSLRNPDEISWYTDSIKELAPEFA